jgi:hypothetical protein
MQTRCPKCTIIVKSIGAQWIIINGPCLELSGTQWSDRPEFCPILSQVVEPDVTLPGAWNRVAIQAEIDRMRGLYAAATGRVGAHIEGMRKARITKTTETHPSYEVWVEQDGRSHLFAIAGSLEDAEEEAREAEREYGLRPIREEK